VELAEWIVVTNRVILPRTPAIYLVIGKASYNQREAGKGEEAAKGILVRKWGGREDKGETFFQSFS
jgi:hypothetical protein